MKKENSQDSSICGIFMLNKESTHGQLDLSVQNHH